MYDGSIRQDIREEAKISAEELEIPRLRNVDGMWKESCKRSEIRKEIRVRCREGFETGNKRM